MKEAADLLSEYTKKAIKTVPIKTVGNTTDPPSFPLSLPPAAAVAPTAFIHQQLTYIKSIPSVIKNHWPMHWRQSNQLYLYI